MELRTLGRTGLKVSDICLGTMVLGAWGNTDHEDSGRLINRALDAGVNFLDTADIYAFGESEEIVGKAIKSRRDEVVLATKFWNGMGALPNQRGGSRRWVIQAVEDSLRRLGTDYIDLYQMHRPDPDAEIDETLAALSDLVRQGKVRYIGSSTFPAEAVVEAQWAAERHRSERFVCEQPPYSIFQRGIETAILPACRRYGVGVIVWSPLASGFLTGKYQRDQAAPGDSRRGRDSVFRHNDADLDARKFDVVDQLRKVAEQAGLSMTHLALAWTLEHPAVTSTIIGPRTSDQLDDLLAASGIRLGADVLDAIDEIVPPGTDLDPNGAGYQPPGLAAEQRRRPRW
jgi:aryl-alcohol dehydrogenase (NADP+)